MDFQPGAKDRSGNSKRLNSVPEQVLAGRTRPSGKVRFLLVPTESEGEQ